jgi:hypothetical protein
VKPVRLPSHVVLCTGDRLGDGGASRVGVDVGEQARELLPRLPLSRTAAELVDRRVGEGPKLVVVQGLTRDADDPVALRKQAGLAEMKESGQELPAGEVAGCAEEDQHVVGRDRDAIHYLAGAAGFRQHAHSDLARVRWWEEKLLGPSSAAAA